MKKYLFTIFLTIVWLGHAAAQKVIYTDDFTQGLRNWIIEKVSEKTVLQTKDSALEVIAPDGITLWYKKQPHHRAGVQPPKC